MISILKKNRNRINAILLIATVICTLFLNTAGVVISTSILIIYFINSNKKSFANRILLIISFIGFFFVFSGIYLLGNMSNKGIDYIGEGIAYATIVNIGKILLLVCPIIILVIDNKRFIFTKKFLTIVGIFVLATFLCFLIYNLHTTDRISENIPTVADFEEELKQRGFMTDTDNYRLYGINSKNKKGIKLYFEKNNIDKYPLYVYSVIDYPWLIYYANGEIYAVRGEYWDYYTGYGNYSGYNEEKIIWDYPIEVISEKEKITVYSIKLNRYKKGSTITYTGFYYYSPNKNKDNSVFIDIPCIESWGENIKQVNKIDINLLNY